MAKDDFKRKHSTPPGGGPAEDLEKDRANGHQTEPSEEPLDDTEKSIDELASLQEELEKAKDHALRCRAEMENFKKRLSRQVEEERRYACLPILQDLLPVLDNMDRAIEAAGKSDNGAGLIEGFGLVAKLLRDVLAKYDCLEIDALGKPFDPHCHQAISQMPSEEHLANTVILVVQPGFQLHDRVVRPSKVIVSTQPTS
ncbi:MAG TPA: nucleotide exchange factor GrpE [Thermoguttaceae bacterium]|nr:nucleotide exchange factor GrpE [Thermoguttaceae bacterium]